VIAPDIPPPATDRRRTVGAGEMFRIHPPEEEDGGDGIAEGLLLGQKFYWAVGL